MKKVAVKIMLITLISKFFGFARDIALSYFYGASNVSDAYLISLTIPDVVSSFVITGIATAFIPMYNQIKERDGSERVETFTNNLINTLTLISLVLYVISLVFTPQIVKLFASGFTQSTIEVAIQLTRISVISILFTGLIALSTGYLQNKDNFVIPALIGFPLNLIIIVSIYISSQTSYFVLAVGLVLATASQLFIMLPSIYKEGFRYKLKVDFKDPDLLLMIKIAIPVIIGSSINQINVLINRTIASRVAVGGISALNYAYMITFFIHGLFVVSIISIIYPSISRMATVRNFEGMKRSITEAIKMVSLIVLPASFGAIVFARPIVNLLYGRGQFEADAINMTSSALTCFAVGMIFVAIREILSRAFYAMQDTRTPMINASIGVVVNIALTPLFSYFLGVGGLALATSVSAIVTVILLAINLRKKIGAFGIANLVEIIIKIVISSTLMAIIAYFNYQQLLFVLPATVALFGAIMMGVIAYGLLIYFIKIDLVDEMMQTVADFIEQKRSKK
ncbi:murein biosynthesis integral membrane protein MurJ [Fundicoccus ignavus]|nr:murein biosynthesis integral membrane protein MurJ [Fundicoccus ignavus]